MILRVRTLGLVFLFLCIFVGNNLAQQSREQFGKNRIQYKNFDWKFYSSENFDNYFYKGGEKIAKDAASFLEDEFERITDLIGYSPYSKTKVFLYNSIKIFQYTILL